MSFLDVDEWFSGLENAFDTVLDKAALARIKKDLHDIADGVKATGFQTFTVDQSVYGNSQVGWSLGYHHSLAHQKVSNSLAAVLQDLAAFSEGFMVFEKKMEDADGGAEMDSRRLKAAADALEQTAGFHHTHEVNNHYHHGGDHA